jgi:choline dehydrogenase-like flavoprotein
MAQSSILLKPLEIVSYFTPLHCSAYFLLIGNNPRFLKATKELIISAGSISTPHILFHSGFGDPDTLKSLGITPVFNMPSLGKNLTDHPRLQIDFAANNTEPKCVVANLSNHFLIEGV